MWEYGESKGNRIIFSLELKNLIEQQPGSGSQPSQKRPFMRCGARARLLLALPNQTHGPHRRLRLLSSLPRGARQGLGSNRRPSRGLLPAGRPPGTAVPGSYQGPRAWSSGDRAAKHLGGFGDTCRSLVQHLWVALSPPPGQQLSAGTGRSAPPGGFWAEAAHPRKNPSLPGHEWPQLPVICPRQRLPALPASSPQLLSAARFSAGARCRRQGARPPCFSPARPGAPRWGCVFRASAQTLGTFDPPLPGDREGRAGARCRSARQQEQEQRHGRTRRGPA